MTLARGTRTEVRAAMDFALSEEQQLIKKTVEELLRRLAPRREAMRRQILTEKKFPYELWDACPGAGLLACFVPESYGGTGQGLLPYALAMETLGQHGFGNALLILTAMDA